MAEALIPQKHGGALRPPYKAGQPSGNPTGRGNKGLVAQVHLKCQGNGKELVAGLYLLFRGSAKQRKKFFGEDVPVSTRDRIEACRELLDRGWGRTSVHEDDAPVYEGNTGPMIVFNLPVSKREFERLGIVDVPEAHA